MVSFQIPVASEIMNLLNFLWSDIILIAAVMFLSARVAGFINSNRRRKGEVMSLKPFDLPHVGGGMVMSDGWGRRLIALLRISAIISVSVGNFGLQGRSEASFTTKLLDVRVPGSVEDLNPALLFNVTEIRMRCAQLEGDQLFFGSVIDNKCYVNLHEQVYVRSLSLGFTSISRSLIFQDCAREEHAKFYYTVLKCDGVDLSCAGPHRDSPKIDENTCVSVAYDDDTSWFCPRGGINPFVEGNQTVICRKVGARKEEIEHWTDLYRNKTEDPLVSIFGAAYSQERMMEVDVPGGERSITIVTLWWILPAIWQVILVTSLLLYYCWLRGHGARTYGNDERSLLKMLRDASEMMDMADGSDGMFGSA